MSDSTVLVSGGTGSSVDGAWRSLLERGHRVRTTVRDLGREAVVREAVSRTGVDAGDRLAVLSADLTSDDGWAAAGAGCRYVLHVASPFPPAQPKDPDGLIVPARDGALRVLRASLDAGVERVVMTSSVAAIRGSRQSSESAPFTEADWTDADDRERTPYVRSKTIAEKASWELVRKAGDEDRLAVVNPGAISGPPLSADRSTSLQAIQRLLDGMPAMPRLGFTFVDVRDVADLHLRAMTDPAGGGERFLAADTFLWTADVAAVIRERLGEAAPKVPTRVAPNLLVRAMALFDGSVRPYVNDLGRRQWISSDKAR